MSSLESTGFSVHDAAVHVTNTAPENGIAPNSDDRTVSQNTEAALQNTAAEARLRTPANRRRATPTVHHPDREKQLRQFGTRLMNQGNAGSTLGGLACWLIAWCMSLKRSSSTQGNSNPSSQEQPQAKTSITSPHPTVQSNEPTAEVQHDLDVSHNAAVHGHQDEVQNPPIPSNGSHTTPDHVSNDSLKMPQPGSANVTLPDDQTQTNELHKSLADVTDEPEEDQEDSESGVDLNQGFGLGFQMETNPGLGLGFNFTETEPETDPDDIDVLGGSMVESKNLERGDIVTINVTDRNSQEVHQESYEIVEYAGKGSFGAVYKAEKDGKVFALKIPLQFQQIRSRDEQLTHGQAVEKFNQEWEFGLGQRFGNTLCQGQDETGQPVQVMTYAEKLELPNPVDGANTERSKEHAGHFRDSMVDLFGQLGQMHGEKSGVADRDDHGIVHLDIDMRNLMLEDGKVRLIDFGVSKQHATGLLKDSSSYFKKPDGGNGVKRGPQYGIFMANLLSKYTGETVTTGNGDEKDKEKVVRSNLSEKTQESLLLSGVILRSMLQTNGIRSCFEEQLGGSEKTIFEQACDECVARLGKNREDKTAMQALKLASFSQKILEKAERTHVAIDATDFHEHLAIRTAATID